MTQTTKLKIRDACFMDIKSPSHDGRQGAYIHLPHSTNHAAIKGIAIQLTRGAR